MRWREGRSGPCTSSCASSRLEILAGGGAIEGAFAPCALFCAVGAADVAPASRLRHGLNFDQLSLVVLHVFYECADGVAGTVDLVVFGREGVEEEGGEGGGGDVLGGEPEDVSDLFASIELGRLGKLKGRVALGIGSNKGKWVPMDHSKSKKHEGLAVFLAAHCNTSKKSRIVVFEHFTHQLVIVLIDPLVTVCIRS